MSGKENKENIIGRGAEAILIHNSKDKNLIKRRISKGYRIPEIDERLRKLRTRSEARLIERLNGKINVPTIISADEKIKEIIMSFIAGKKLSDYLDDFQEKQQEEICREIGKEVAKMHDENIVHGDLTTSNMILAEKEDNKKIAQMDNQLDCPHHKNSYLTNKNKLAIFFIDFGLSFYSERIEDKAVDIHLFKQALESKHFKNWQNLYKSFLEAYSSKDKTKILAQLEKVEKRGRYRH